MWYRAYGWPVANCTVLNRMYEKGRITMCKFLKASLASMDVVTCVADRTHHVTDNTWVYVQYTYTCGMKVPCVGQIQYFVRVRASDGAAAVFDPSDCQEDPPAPQVCAVRNTEGRLVYAKPVKFAVCKMWVGHV